MQTPQQYVFYGSLRRGMDLYHRFQEKLEYKYSQWLKGYELYSLGAYPFALKSTDSNAVILVEVFEIKDEKTASEIHAIEMEAGYVFDVIELNGVAAGIYCYEKCTNEPKVESGDWVDFYCR